MRRRWPEIAFAPTLVLALLPAWHGSALAAAMPLAMERIENQLRARNRNFALLIGISLYDERPAAGEFDGCSGADLLITRRGPPRGR